MPSTIVSSSSSSSSRTGRPQDPLRNQFENVRKLFSMNHYCIHTILIQVGSGSSQCTVCDKIIPSRRIETLRTHVAKCEATPASQRQRADTDNEDTPTKGHSDEDKCHCMM